jgi:hypothetical protein
MGYRDDLILQMQQDGSWNQLTGDKQAQVQRLTDEEARSYMVLCDEWDMGEAKAQASVGITALSDLLSSFKMNLVEMANNGKPKLSKAGTLLADFVTELQTRGLSLTEIEGEFATLHSSAIASLIIISRLE